MTSSDIPFQKSLTFKISAAILAGMTFSIVTLTFLTFSFMNGILKRSIMENQLRLTKQTLSEIDRLLYERFSDIQQIAGEEDIERFLTGANPERADAMTKGLERRMNELSFVTGPWDALFVVDKEGKVVLWADDPVLGPDIASYPVKKIAYDIAMKGQPYYSDLVISKDTGMPTIIFAAPVRDYKAPGKPVVGVVIGNLAWPAVLEILKGAPSYAILLNERGQLIGSGEAMSRPELIVESLQGGGDQQLVGGLGSGSMIVPKGSILKEEALASIAVQNGHLSYRGNHWSLLLAEPTEKAFAPATRAAARLMLIIIAVMVLSLFIILFAVVILILRPVKRLHATIRVIAIGDLSQQASVSTDDEIGELALSFNAMTAKLRGVYDSLEEKVKQRSKEAMEERERLMVTLRSIGDAVITTDIEGRVVLLNNVAEVLTGWSQEDAKGRALDDVFRIIHADTRQPAENPFKKVMAAGMVTGLPKKTILVSKHGQERFIDDSGAPILNVKNETIGVVLVFRDITDDKKIEAQLLQSQKMETVGTLAGGIAHDLNNQLTPIRGYLDLLQHQTPTADPIYEHLSEANQCAKRCVEIIQRLVNFSRPSTQTKSTIHLEPLFAEIKKMLTQFLPANIRVESRCEKELLPLQGNETELQTVIMNLAANARDAMPEGGSFIIEAKNMHLEAEVTKRGIPPGDYVFIDVRDSGLGMFPETVQRIFEPFFSTKEKGKGTGLGLAMVFSIIKDHGGWIDVSSEVGSGTSFHLYLPAADREARVIQAPVVSESTPIPRGTETVLFADDEDKMRSMGKVFLERLGYTVLLAADGKEALEIFRNRKNEIKVAILDMTMPHLTGRQLIQKLLAIDPSMKIILASGYTSEGTPEELLREGAKEYIQKPYTISPLARSLRRVLDAG